MYRICWCTLHWKYRHVLSLWKDAAEGPSLCDGHLFQLLDPWEGFCCCRNPFCVLKIISSSNDPGEGLQMTHNFSRICFISTPANFKVGAWVPFHSNGRHSILPLSAKTHSPLSSTAAASMCCDKQYIYTPEIKKKPLWLHHKAASRRCSGWWLLCKLDRWQPEQFISQFPYQHTLSSN